VSLIPLQALSWQVLAAEAHIQVGLPYAFALIDPCGRYHSLFTDEATEAQAGDLPEITLLGRSSVKIQSQGC
jgi:hypothetical protein